MVGGCTLTAQERIAFSVGDPEISTSPPSCKNECSQQQISFFQRQSCSQSNPQYPTKKRVSNKKLGNNKYDD
jgi:hypothetical protein